MQLQHTVQIKLRRERETKDKIPLGAKRSRNAMQSLDDKSMWITQKEGHMSNNVTQKLIGGFVKKIQRGDMKNSNVTPWVMVNYM